MRTRKSFLPLLLLLLSVFLVPLSMNGDGNVLMDASSESIQNSGSYTATDISELPHHRSPISLLVYTEFADLQTGGHGEFNNTMYSIRNTYATAQTTFNYENLTDYTELETRLWDYDVLLIPEQEKLGSEDVSNIVDAWGAILHEWTNAGGIVIMLDCYSGSIGEGPTSRIYNQTGLMHVDPYDAVPTTIVFNVNTSSPLTQGVSASWASSDGSFLFDTTDGNIVVDDGAHAMVAHKIIGKGHVVLLGFDMFTIESNQSIILANAIRLHHHIVFDQSHSPYYTLDSGFTSLVEDLQFLGYACSAMNTFNIEYLQASDVLVLTSSTLFYSSAEAEYIQDFVASGGGLFVASDWGQYGSELDPVIEQFDIERNKTSTLEDSDDLVGLPSQFASAGDNIIFHSATFQVNVVEIYAGTGFIQLPDNAVPLIIADSDGSTTFSGEMIANQTPISAALTAGAGRIIVFGDTNALDDQGNSDGDGYNNYEDADNDLFFMNCFRWLTAAGLEEVSIVFDESHGPNFTVYSSFLGLARLLTQNGFTIYRMTNFDLQYLEDKDILFIVDGSVDYFENETQWIHDYVNAGNGLLLLGAYGVYGEQAATVANEFGIDMDTSGSYINETDDASTYDYNCIYNQSNFGDHPIMNDVSRLEFQYNIGINDTGESTPIVTTDGDGTSFWTDGRVANNVPIVVAQEFVMGRIVVSGDYVSMRYNLDGDADGIRNLYEADNILFWLNVLSWLGENRAPVVQVDNPNGGEKLTGDQLITWDATDGNSDSMTFSVHYSPNGGGSWTALAMGLSSASYLWHTSLFDDGDDYLIRVSASDGELIGLDTSDAVFIVDNHGPTISGINHDSEVAIIEANVTDISGVDTVLCEYSLNNGTWMSLEMLLGSGDTYSCRVAPIVVDASVQYRLRANDTLGHWSDYTPIGEFNYTVPLPTTGTTTTTETTTETIPVPGDITTLLLILIGAGAVVVIIIIIVVMKKRK